MVLVGKPGTGKTTVLRKILRSALSEGRRALIVTPHENEWEELPLVNPRFPGRVRTYRGARRILCHGEKEILENIVQNFKNGMLVFDDCKAYVKPAIGQTIETLLLSCRQNDVDFFACGHGFTKIPPAMFAYATHFCIFATTDNVKRRENDVNNYDVVADTVARVNRYAISNRHYYEIIKNE